MEGIVTFTDMHTFRALGAPLGEATTHIEGKSTTFKRQFSHGTNVSLTVPHGDSKTQWNGAVPCIRWADGSTTGTCH